VASAVRFWALPRIKIFSIDAVLVEQAVVEGGVEMDKPARHGTGGDAHRQGALTWFGKIRVGAGRRSGKQDD
jgi:hypothetical protein